MTANKVTPPIMTAGLATSPLSALTSLAFLLPLHPLTCQRRLLTVLENQSLCHIATLLVCLPATQTVQKHG